VNCISAFQAKPLTNAFGEAVDQQISRQQVARAFRASPAAGPEMTVARAQA
jgi:hypothetical protein